MLLYWDAPTVPGDVVRQQGAVVYVGESLAPANLRVSQAGLEVADAASTTNIRVSQAGLEVLDAPSNTNIRVAQLGIEVVYPFRCASPPPGPPGPATPVTQRIIRRVRRAPHLVGEPRRRIFYERFQLILQEGQGTVTGQGRDPQVMVRISRDGGATWGNEIWISAGQLGDYRKRVIARRLGYARDAIFEVTVSDPIAWAIVAASLDTAEGIS